jgi:hypothetical protein
MTLTALSGTSALQSMQGACWRWCRPPFRRLLQAYLDFLGHRAHAFDAFTARSALIF